MVFLICKLLECGDSGEREWARGPCSLAVNNNEHNAPFLVSVRSSVALRSGDSCSCARQAATALAPSTL